MGADGVPLDSFTPASAQTVVAIFAQASLWRLFFRLVGATVLIRYRSGVPLMFALFALNYLAAQLAFAYVPLPRVGAPVGPLVDLALFVLMGTFRAPPSPGEGPAPGPPPGPPPLPNVDFPSPPSSLV